jgi:hypothetical protein
VDISRQDNGKRVGNTGGSQSLSHAFLALRRRILRESVSERDNVRDETFPLEATQRLQKREHGIATSAILRAEFRCGRELANRSLVIG